MCVRACARGEFCASSCSAAADRFPQNFGGEISVSSYITSFFSRDCLPFLVLLLEKKSGNERRWPDERIVGDLPPALSLSSSTEN